MVRVLTLERSYGFVVSKNCSRLLTFYLWIMMSLWLQLVVVLCGLMELGWHPSALRLRRKAPLPPQQVSKQRIMLRRSLESSFVRPPWTCTTRCEKSKQRCARNLRRLSMPQRRMKIPSSCLTLARSGLGLHSSIEVWRFIGSQNFLWPKL